MASLNNTDDRMSMLLSSYLDGGLTKQELGEVVAALENEAVVAEFRELKEVRRALRVLPMLDLPLSLLPGDHLAEQLSAYLDGELATTEMPIVSTHLDTCSECRRELAELDRSRTAVRALPGIEPPSFLDVHRLDTKERKRFNRTAIAALTSVAAVSIALALGTFSSTPEPSAVSISDLQVRHSAVSSAGPSGSAVQIVNAP